MSKTSLPPDESRRKFIKTMVGGIGGLAASAIAWPLGSMIHSATELAALKKANPKKHYDVIVLGLGAIGSSSCYHLAQKGAKVLGIERFEKIPHVHGSSHGDTRAIRKAYFEGDVYVPLLNRSYELWRDLEAKTGTKIMDLCGVLYWGERKSSAQTLGIIQKVVAVAKRQGVQTITYDGAEAEKKWPMYRRPIFPGTVYDAVFEPEAGYLNVNTALKAQIELAQKYGAKLHFSEPIQSFQVHDSIVYVKTDKDEYTADQIIIAAGPWSKEILSEYLNLPLILHSRVQLWFYANNMHHLDGQKVPCFGYDLPAPYGLNYGFPKLPHEKGIKMADLTQLEGKSIITQPSQLLMNSDTTKKRIQESIDKAKAFLKRFCPDVDSTQNPYREEPCFVTIAPDDHWIIDKVPAHSRLNIACGFSGHGFKCCPAVGEVLAAMALGLKQNPKYDLDYFTIKRAKERS
jgi:sarcosine oxidase